MKIASLCIFFIGLFLMVIYGIADPVMVFWPMFPLLFFWNTQKTIVVAFIAGIFLDLYSPIPLYFVLFPLVVLLGKILIDFFFSHRTFFSFQVVCLLLITILSALEYCIFWIFSILHTDSVISMIELKYFIAFHLLIIFAQIPLLSLIYIIAHRVEGQFGYAIDTVRRI